MISTCQILGIQFFNGDVDDAVQSMIRRGGFLIAPSGTCFARLREDEWYRRAVLSADLAIADSGLMVLLCRLFRRESLQRISGLKYLKHLLATLKGGGTEEVFWIVPSGRARQKLLDWSQREFFSIKMENSYVAPRYGSEVEDRDLVALIDQHRPAHVIIAIGSGAQEKLGYYLRENLSYRPAIHCTGAALGFITGDQSCNSRLGRPILSRLVLAIASAAAHFHPPTVPRSRASVVDLEIWRKFATAAKRWPEVEEVRIRVR